MSKLIHITMLVVLLLGFVAIQAANITEPTLLTTVEDGQAVQIGRIWVPAEQSVLDFMREAQDYNAPLPVNVGGISIP